MGDSPQDVLANLHAGWRPGPHDIASADVVERWQIFWRGEGPYLLQGVVNGQPCLAGLVAIDQQAGWALVQDRLLVLGERTPEACIAVAPDEVMRRAAGLFGPEDNAADLGARVLELAQQAERAGFAAAVQLLQMAAREIETAIQSKRRAEPV